MSGTFIHPVPEVVKIDDWVGTSVLLRLTEMKHRRVNQ